MDLKGIPLELHPEEFPFRIAISKDSIYQQMHFVLPKELMIHRVRTLSDFKSGRLAYAHIAALTFVAEACSNVVKHRGELRPDQLMHDIQDNYAARISPVLTYIPKRTHSGAGDPLPPEELLDDDNIVAYMFSILVRDPELDLSYAMADQIDINCYGPPSKRTKGDDDGVIEVHADGHQQPLLQVNEPNNLAGPNAFDSDNDDDFVEVNNEAPAAVPVPVSSFNIDNDHYRCLDGYGSKYWYPKKMGFAADKYKPEVREIRGQLRAEAHKAIMDTKDYVNFFACMIKKLSVVNQSYMRLTGTTTTFNVTDIRADDPVHYSNAYSLAAAVSLIEGLGAAPAFCDVLNWSDLSNNFVVPEQTQLHVAALLRLGNFNAQDLFDFCLPHCQITDLHRIRPSNESNVVETVTLDDGSQMNLESVFINRNIKLPHERLDELKSKHVTVDCWLDYFERFKSVEIDMQRRFHEQCGHLTPEYKRDLRNFRIQGIKYHSSCNTLTNMDLPDGNVALIKHRIKKGDIHVPILHLFEPKSDDTKSPFSQWRANELLFAESILKISDFMVPIFPKVMLGAIMVWLPFMNGATNKEHQQFIGPPGTLKSDTLGRIQKTLIEDTFAEKSGGSKMGILGPNRSQRLIEIYHELNSILAPSGDPQGSDKDTTEMKLNQLGEGRYVYDSTAEDPATNMRFDIRKVSHYTNLILGAKNPPGRTTMSRDGSGAAMLDRFTRYRIIPTSTPGRMTIAERVFQDFMRAGQCADMPREIYQVIQLAAADYCCLMSCYAVPLPNIDLFSDIAPNAIAYLAIMHPELANRLREIARIKTRLYAEIISNMAKYALCSAIGLAGRALETGEPYIYDTEEVVNEMSKYAYTDLETLIYVLSSSVYNMSEGQYNAIAAAFVLETTTYKPIDTPGTLEKPLANLVRKPDDLPLPSLVWPQPIDLDTPVANQAEARNRAAAALDANNWSLEEVLEEVIKKGKNRLGKPYTNYKTGEQTEQAYIMRPHHRAIDPNSDGSRYNDDEENLDLDLFSAVAGVTNEHREPPRLHHTYVADTIFKVEQLKNGPYVNFNYLRIDGSPDDFANSFSDGVGERVMTPDSIKDVIYALKRTRVIAPYIPVLPHNHTLVVNHPGFVQSLRHSHTAIRRFNLYNLPVIIEAKKKFYMLISFAETNPAVVIEKMVESMCYQSTRETHTVVGVPDRHSNLDFQALHIKPRKNVALTVARKTNLTKEHFERLQKQFGIDEDSVDGFSANGNSDVYTDVDIEEEKALKAISYAHPDMDRDEALRFTPRGIWKRLYGADGVYKEGNPWTIKKAEPNPAKRKAEDVQRGNNNKRQQQQPPVNQKVIDESLAAEINRVRREMLKNIDDTAERNRVRREMLKNIDDVMPGKQVRSMFDMHAPRTTLDDEYDEVFSDYPRTTLEYDEKFSD